MKAFVLLSLALLSGCAVQGQQDIVPINNVTIEVCEETIFRYTEPQNFIQPMHEYVSYHLSEKTLMVHDITECSKGVGMSMQPTTFDGNTVCYKYITGEDILHVGDIILYKRDKGQVVHRIRAIYEGRQGKQLLVQGDSLSAQDMEWVDKTDVIAKAVVVIYT